MRTSRAIATLVAASLVVAACGGDDDDDSADDDAATEETAGDTGDDEPADTADDGDEPADTEATDDGDGGGDGDGDGDDAASTTPETAAPATAAPSESGPAYGGSIVVAGEAEAGTPWTPAAVQCDSYCQMRARTFYDPLVAVDNDLNVQGVLAESVTPNDDHTVFTIKLREGVEFHDSTPFDADAAIFNINQSFNGLLIAGAVKDVARNADGSILIEKLDDFTFTLQTGFNGNPDEPISWPLFPYYLGGQGGFMASPTWLQAVADGSGDAAAPVGTGPFMLTSYEPGDRLTVERNPNYWMTDEDGNELPYLDSIEFRVIPDSQVRSQALTSGDVDLIATSDPNAIYPLLDDDDVESLLQAEYTETNYVMLNLTKPYLADQRVRCALLQAVNPQEFVDVVVGGNAVVANGPFTPGQEGFLEDNGRLPYDVEAASAAIAEYEAENGELTINYSTTPTTTNLAAAQYLESVWSAIGVDVVIDQIEQSELITNALFGDPAFDAFGWRNHAGLFVDTQYFWWHGFSAAPPGELALNFGRLDDPEINAMLEAQRTELDPEVRRGIAEDINRRFAEQCFIIPTSQTQWGVHYQPAIENIGRSPLPDGGFMRDGAGFPGQVWLTAAFLAEE